MLTVWRSPHLHQNMGVRFPTLCWLSTVWWINNTTPSFFPAACASLYTQMAERESVSVCVCVSCTTNSFSKITTWHQMQVQPRQSSFCTPVQRNSVVSCWQATPWGSQRHPAGCVGQHYIYTKVKRKVSDLIFVTVWLSTYIISIFINYSFNYYQFNLSSALPGISFKNHTVLFWSTLPGQILCENVHEHDI